MFLHPGTCRLRVAVRAIIAAVGWKVWGGLRACEDGLGHDSERCDQKVADESLALA